MAENLSKDVVLNEPLTLPTPDGRRCAIIDRQAFNILKEGAGNAKATSVRDISIGALLTGITSAIGIGTSGSFSDPDKTPNWVTIAFLCVFICISVVSLVLVAFFHRRV